MKPSRTEKATLFLVASNGRPLNDAGWMAPIVRREDTCYVHGEKSPRSFSSADLGQLADSGLIALVEPIPFDKAFPSDGPSDRELGRGPMTLPCLLFYVRREAIAELDAALDSELGLECASRGTGVAFIEEPSTWIVRALRRQELRDLLRHLSVQILVWLRKELGKRLGQNAFSATVELPEDVAARFLCQIAFDVNSARHAIEMRGLTTLLGPEHDHFGPWLERAALAWGLKTDRSYWSDRIRDAIVSIGTEHAVRQFRPRMNVTEIREMVVRELFQWSLGALGSALAQNNKLPITNPPERSSRIR